MGANAQTSVPTFTAGEVLTAANMNISARTGIPVFADTTARDAAFGGSKKTLAEGQYAYIENIAGSAATQYYDGAAWQTLVSSGLNLISRSTPTAASTLTFDNVFSSTYATYMISLEQVTTSSAGSYMSFNLRYGSTTNTAASWYGGIFGASYAGATFAGNATSGGTSFRINTALDPAGNGSTFNLIVSGVGSASLKPGVITQNAEYPNGVVRNGSAILQNDTQTYTGFILTNSAGNLTATVAIYGLA